MYLDEPSAGLDPLSKMDAWRVIKDAKSHAAILLTSHDMMESDVLCDRVCIMHDGKMRCVGDASNLKRNFGGGYGLEVHLRDSNVLLVKRALEILQTYSPSTVLIESTSSGGIVWFKIPSPGKSLSSLYSFMNDRQAELGIVDWAISEATMEDVFFHVIKQRESDADFESTL